MQPRMAANGAAARQVRVFAIRLFDKGRSNTLKHSVTG